MNSPSNDILNAAAGHANRVSLLRAAWEVQAEREESAHKRMQRCAIFCWGAIPIHFTLFLWAVLA